MRLRRHKARPRIEMLPLMDVVLLLLVFFIYSMLTMTEHMGMVLTLPESGQAQRETFSVLALTVAADGSLFVDKEPVAPGELTEVLRQKREESADDEALDVQIFAEDSLSYQDLYRVLDAVKAAQIRKISLQAKRQSAQ